MIKLCIYYKDINEILNKMSFYFFIKQVLFFINVLFVMDLRDFQILYIDFEHMNCVLLTKNVLNNIFFLKILVFRHNK